MSKVINPYIKREKKQECEEITAFEVITSKYNCSSILLELMVWMWDIEKSEPDKFAKLQKVYQKHVVLGGVSKIM